MGLNILKYLSNLKKQDESEVITNKQKFDSVMRVANEIAKDRPRDLYKLIKILGKKIQYDYFADFIQHTGIKGLEDHSHRFLTKPTPANLWVNEHKKGVPPELKSWIQTEITNASGDKKVDIDLSKDVILSGPWKFNRLLDSLANIGKDRPWGEWQQDDFNHMVLCWEPIGVSFVANGNHSIMAGIVGQEGKIKSDIITEMSPMYDIVSCDGENYYFFNKDKNEKVIASEVIDLDFAIIYEIGRILNTKGIRYWA